MLISDIRNLQKTYLWFAEMNNTNILFWWSGCNYKNAFSLPYFPRDGNKSANFIKTGLKELIVLHYEKTIQTWKYIVKQNKKGAF